MRRLENSEAPTTRYAVTRAVWTGAALVLGGVALLTGMPLVMAGVSDDGTQEALRALMAQGDRLLGDEKYEAAQLTFEHILTVDRQHTGALVGLAMLESKRGNPDEAIRRYGEALCIDPANIDSLLGLRHAHLSRNSLGMESRPDYDTAVEPMIRAFGEYGKESQRWPTSRY